MALDSGDGPCLRMVDEIVRLKGVIAEMVEVERRRRKHYEAHSRYEDWEKYVDLRDEVFGAYFPAEKET